MNWRVAVLITAILACVAHSENLHRATAKPPRNKASAAIAFPTQSLLPKAESGALRLLAAHLEFDGRGVIVGVFDTGVDPGVAGLQTTSDGRPKLIDMVDATGSGDVDTSEIRTVKANAKQPAAIEGMSGRQLTLSPKWIKPEREFHVGLSRAYDLFPAGLVGRVKRERRRAFDLAQAAAEAKLRQQIADWDAAHPRPNATQKMDRANLTAAWQELVAARDYEDPGPLFDCVVFHDGRRWQAVVDTDEDGDLAEEKLLTNYREARQYGTFGPSPALNFAVNIYEQGNRLSIVVDSTPHGTHVAGIIAANFPDDARQNGIAPGAQVVSIKIGDTRLGSMETGAALERAVIAAVNAGCHVVNMSYGEPVAEANRGRVIGLLSELAERHNIIFVAAAGNNGPALSTVIAPGGTTTSVLGVAAYLSPEMMRAQYTTRESLAEMPYPWSSRGPTADGDGGVDLLAPGGAIAPVSHWTQQRSMQMNGTSMASPSAAGAVALLVSAALQQKISYTPTSIRRALQNTARPVAGSDKFEQGPGLLQVDLALKHLLKYADAPLERTPLAVRCGRQGESVGGRSLRGIYLREPHLSNVVSHWQVELKTEFPEETSSADRLASELSLRLSASADWIRCGETLLLTHGRRTFDVEVDPRRLPPGVHTAEIVAVDAKHPGRGPLARVAVTVIRPQPLESEAGPARHRERLRLEAGGLARRFFAVPAGATWADARVSSPTAAGPRSFVLHTAWLTEGEKYRDAIKQQHFTLDSAASVVRSIPVTGGTMLEVCLGQNWKSLGETEVELDITFHSLLPAPSELSLSASRAAAEVRLQAALGRESIAPTAKLTTRRTLLLPEKSELTPLDSRRDRLPDGRQFYQLLLTYRFNQTEPGPITPRLPGLDGRLYEASGGSLLWQLFDAGKRRVRSDDIWPSAVKLGRGEHRLRLALRHTDAKWLDAARQQALCLDRPLAKSIELKISLLAPGKDDATGQLAAGDSALLAVQAPTLKQLPAGLSPGDELLGEIRYGRDAPLSAGRGYRPGLWPVRYAVGPTAAASDAEKNSSTDDDPRPLAKRLADERLAARVRQLESLQRDEQAKLFEQLAAEILREKPHHLPVLLARLKRLDTVAGRKQRLDEVIAAADAVLARINTKELAAHFGQRTAEDDPAAQERHRELLQQREILTDTLYRKGRAIGYKELPEVLAKHPIKDQAAQDKAFERNFAELARWVDTTDERWFLLNIRRDRRRGHSGTALSLLNRRTKTMAPNFWHTKKRRDLFEDLGWSHLAGYEERWMVVRFPKAFDLP